ncbi:MAG: MFS transporter [Alphaproteobacteria bacterium]
MRFLPASATPDARRLIAARGLRAVGDGFVSVLLPAYLLELGLDAFAVGIVSTAALLGSALLTLAVGATAASRARRTLLLAGSALMVATGLAFAGLSGFWPLLVIAFLGTINPSAGDVTVFLPLEHTLLTDTVADVDRTALFARYSLVGSMLAAAGTLLAALPETLGVSAGFARLDAMRLMFVLYAAIGLGAACLYGTLSRPAPAAAARPVAPLGPSKAIVFRMAALFSLDSFGSGFFVQSLLALWLFDRFGLSLAAAATVFFWMNVLNAFSFLLAARIAARIGLINTMVFTHIPANLCVMLLPFVDQLWLALALLMGRGLLSQMDVPTRTSYVMAVVTPEERPAAASVTAVPRSLAAAAAPMLAGYLFKLSPFGWPLLIGGALKIAYDLALLALFRHIRPPEEMR